MQDKNTPLHIAAKHGHILIVKYLLSQGALTNIPNESGATPIEMAQGSIKVLREQVFDKSSRAVKIGGLSKT